MRKSIEIAKNTSTFYQDFQNNNKAVLRAVYSENYVKIERYVLKNNGSVQQAKDVFQESFLACWKNIKNGKFMPGSIDEMNAYLYRISKNKWLDFLRSKEYRFNKRSDFLRISEDTETRNDWDESNNYDSRMETAMMAFNRLGEACKSILTKFYFEKKSMEEIGTELNLDPASARNKKYRCMKKLKKLALEN